MQFHLFLSLLVLFVFFVSCEARARGIVRFPESVQTLEYTPRPILAAADLPTNFDWRNINGTNYCSRTLTQKAVAVCGSCWSTALTGALTDRYLIATQGRLQIQLSAQNLLNFKKHITGGSCEGGDALKGYEFIHKYGITDDACMPYRSLEYIYGFEVHDMTSVEDVQAHMCYTCLWNGDCGFVPRKDYDVYSVDEFGNALGEDEMMSEIFARGPIACMVNSDAPAFETYRGGLMQNIPAKYNKDTDHVVVIAGWGVDRTTNVKFWVGRNSYGAAWGEGAGGGWFRLQRGVNALGMEAANCHWATPAKADVARALEQWQESVAM